MPTWSSSAVSLAGGRGGEAIPTTNGALPTADRVTIRRRVAAVVATGAFSLGVAAAVAAAGAPLAAAGRAGWLGAAASSTRRRVWRRPQRLDGRHGWQRGWQRVEGAAVDAVTPSRCRMRRRRLVVRPSHCRPRRRPDGADSRWHGSGAAAGGAGGGVDTREGGVSPDTLNVHAYGGPRD